MRFKTLLTMVLAIAVTCSLNAQELLQATEGISKQKTSYLTLEDGTAVEGKISKMKWKKGLIEEIRIKTESGEKYKFVPSEIAHMYLPPSSLAKLAKAMDNTFDTQRWGAEDINHELLKDGYVYFEQAPVYVKKKERTLMMQLLNPHFAGKVRVYHDPFAKKTASVGIGGMTVAGGIDKSYYVKQGDEVAVRLKKKDYKKDQFGEMWKDCPAVAEQYGEDVDWDELVKHIIVYSECK